MVLLYLIYFIKIITSDTVPELTCQNDLTRETHTVNHKTQVVDV